MNLLLFFISLLFKKSSFYSRNSRDFKRKIPKKDRLLYVKERSSSWAVIRNFRLIQRLYCPNRPLNASEDCLRFYGLNKNRIKTFKLPFIDDRNFTFWSRSNFVQKKLILHPKNRKFMYFLMKLIDRP